MKSLKNNGSLLSLAFAGMIALAGCWDPAAERAAHYETLSCEGLRTLQSEKSLEADRKGRSAAILEIGSALDSDKDVSRKVGNDAVGNRADEMILREDIRAIQEIRRNRGC